MKKILFTTLSILTLLTLTTYGASIYLPFQGGTGTSTIPTLGQMLVGGSSGNYAPTTTLQTLNIIGVPTSNPFIVSSSTGSTLFSIFKNGNVSIGTTTSSQKLLVDGVIQSSGNMLSGGSIKIGSNQLELRQNPSLQHQFELMSHLTINGVLGVSATANGAYGIVSKGSTLDDSTYVFGGYNASNTWTSTISSAGKAYFASKVGIGTSSPGSSLGVVGDVDTTGNFKSPTTSYYFNPTTGLFNVANGYVANLYGSDSVQRLAFASGKTYFPSTAGNVGIGTTGPTSELHIKGTSPDTMIRVQPAASTDFAGVEYRTTTDGDAVFTGFRQSTGEFRFNNVFSGGYIDFMIGSGSKLTIANSGNVGIGTSTPSNTLTVATGSIATWENIVSTSTDITIDWTQGNQQLIRYGIATTTITFSNVLAGQTIKVITCAPPSGTPGVVNFSTTTNPVYWSGGSLPANTQTVKKCDVWSFLGTKATSSLVVFGAQTASF